MPGQAPEDLTSLVNSSAEECRPFSPFIGQGSAAVYVSELLLAQKWVKEGSEVWTYGWPVIPGPAQPKTVTVYHCLSCWDRVPATGRINGGF